MSSNEPVLKPCPFCGGDAGFKDHGLPATQVGCNGCGVAHWLQDRAKARDWWNTRTLSQADGRREVGDGDILLLEAARDLLDLWKADQRTVGYRVDRWECLRANVERLA